MRMVDVITKKRDGYALTKEEIDFFVNGYVESQIPDYQASALLMAIYFNGLDEEEIVNLTLAMANSGKIIDLSSIEGIKVDKHSTGGVGDKTTLIVAPIVASFGVRVAKMSGRGLGFTGGTIDKLESIPGFKTTIKESEFLEIVNKVGFSIIGQSENVVPADKKIYALRDVSGSVESLPLVASSVMSKKIASGADCILLDVKTGSGAFMKTLEESIKLAKTMVDIGTKIKKKTAALITNMDVPLGRAIGNSLEIIEVCKTLKGEGPIDLEEVSINLAANMLNLAGKGSIEECKVLAKKAILDGSAFKKLKEMVKSQHGKGECLEDYSIFKKAQAVYEVKSQVSGFISKMDAQKCGKASMILGAGRKTKDSEIDFSAGIILNKKYRDFVEEGETIATLYASDLKKCLDAEKVLKEAIIVTGEKSEPQKLVYGRVSSSGLELY